MSALLETAPTEETKQEIIELLGAVSYHLGVNYFNTDENKNAEDAFRRSVRLLLSSNSIETTAASETDGEVQLANLAFQDTQSVQGWRFAYFGELIDCFNYLGMLFSGRMEYHRSKSCLEVAMRIYSSMPQTAASSSMDIEHLHTMTVFYLAQLYTSLNDSAKVTLTQNAN